MADINFETDVTKQMFEVVAEALLYKEDVKDSLKKSKLCPKNWNMSDYDRVVKYILRHPDFKEVQQDYEKLQSSTLIDDNINTIMLMYNRMLQQAQAEQKYDVVVRILKEIRQIKAIENEQMKFEITFKIQGKDE